MLKMNREKLNEEAGKIRVALQLDESKGNADVFLANIGQEWKVFADYCKEGHTDDEEKSAVKRVNAAIELYHEEMQTERLEQLASMDSAEADAEFLRCQSVVGFLAKKDSKAGWQLLTKTTKNKQEIPVYSRISAYDFIKMVHPVESDGIANLCTIFAEFMAMDKVGTDGITRKEKWVSDAYRAKMEALASKGGCWERGKDGAFSSTKLQNQLTEIWGMMFRGVEIPHAVSADIKFLKDIFVTAKVGTGSDGCVRGSYTKKNEETIINGIYTAAFHRMNKLPYDFQDNSNIGGTPYGVAENKDMAEAPATPEKAPVAETVAPAA